MDSSIEFSKKAGRIKEIEQGTSISEFLSSSYLHTIAQTIEREYYPTEAPDSGIRYISC